MFASMIWLAGCGSDKNGNEQIIEESINATEIVLSTEIQKWKQEI